MLSRRLRIALYHNLGAGGGKRHLFEQARELTARGHACDLFVPSGANENYLPLAPFCGNVNVYGGEAGTTATTGSAAMAAAPTPSGQSGRLRSIVRSLLGNAGHDLLAEIHWAFRHRALVTRLAGLNRQIARDIDARDYDVAYVHQCALTLAPDLLRLLERTSSVFVCNDTPRWAYEWALDGPDNYDARPAPLGRRKHLGRWLSPVQKRMAEETNRQFVANTRAADLVLSNSAFSREATVRLTGANPRIVYPGVDADFYAPADRAYIRETGLVVSVGALLPTKQHEFILRSVASIASERRPRIEIIGYESPAPGNTGGIGREGARLRATAIDLGVDLTIRTDVSDEVIRDAYRRATIVAFAPYLEPFGLVALEAMACATPVVGVREGGLRETIRDGETGFLTDRDTASFGRALHVLLSDREVRQEIGEAGRAAVVRDWTWSRSVDGLEALLQSTAKAR